MINTLIQLDRYFHFISPNLFENIKEYDNPN